MARAAGDDEDGATAIEYALIAAGIGAAVAATVWSLGTTTNAASTQSRREPVLIDATGV